MHELPSLVPAVQEAWNAWEIHFLMLLSLFLQVFLFLFAGMRRRSTSGVLRTVLWLAYLSADSVAIFVLGHLAVHASEPGHQLMSFWAPFVLVHLGGQDNITAFSKQDSELWRRHLLSVVTQVGVAGYVVAKASWPDHRLRAAMALIFISGSFKYAERTICLFFASTMMQSSTAKNSLADTLEKLQGNNQHKGSFVERAKERLDAMLRGGRPHKGDIVLDNTFAGNAPLNSVESILAADQLPGMLAEFLPGENRHRAYQYVEAYLLNCYHALYTKHTLMQCWYDLCGCCLTCFKLLDVQDIDIFSGEEIAQTCILTWYLTCVFLPFLWYPLFQCFSTPIALLLFAYAEKDQLDAADVTVSYILLVGAIILDLSSATLFILSQYFTLPPALCSKKQWSKELAQYSMIKRHTAVQEMRLRVGKFLGDWAIGYLEVTDTPITEDRTSIKIFILDSLLLSGTKSQWNIASTRGQLALGKWMDRHQATPYSDTARITKVQVLEESISNDVDFPTSLLIWHIATDICYYTSTHDSNDDQLKKHKQMSRELSNYIMYIVFKCGVMLTNNSELLHDKAHDEIRKVIATLGHQEASLEEKDVFMKIFSANKQEQQDHLTVDIPVPQHRLDNNASDNHMQKLLESAEALRSPLLPRACAVVEELNSINDEANRWELIASVWSEMLFYTAPRCGGGFHHEHLGTGGEFVTHVLHLMYSLGPFLPAPGARGP